jgi:WD40 repeat protein/tetratricopeptide (TPR) repeat protein/predicted Ser/Thr protein kinase
VSEPTPGERSDQTVGYTPAEPDDGPLPATVKTTPGQSLRTSFSRTTFRGPAPGDPADPDNQVGPYEVLDELGKGGMGVVYRARHVSLNRTVALKMILGGGAGPGLLERFRVEAEAVARLQHPGIVQVYDVGDHRGQPYMAMELIDGGSLAAKLDGKPQNPRFAAQTAETLCRAMAVAHQFNIVHRDLKPHNVLLTRDGQPKITDFGLAKDLDRLSSNTRAGSILGTPSYMAPEQAAGRVADIGPGTDVYALGAILYEMLTGRPPFRGESPIDTIRLVLDGEVTPARQLVPKVPRDLDTICLKALQKPVHRRYLTAAEMAEDLRRFLDGEPIRARPIGPVERAVKWVRRRPTTASLIAAGVLALVAFVALGAWSWVQISERADRAEKATDRAEKALADGTRRMVWLNVASGTRRLDEGDYLGSVLWLAEALRLELDLKGDGADREHVHKVRLKAVLDRCPRPVRKWLHEGALNDAVFGADGRVVFTAGEDGVGRVWDVATGKGAGPPLEHGSPVRFIALSPDGRRAATAGADGTLKVWDVATGTPAFPTVVLGVQFTGLAYSPRGDRVLAVGAAGRARVWDAATGAVVSTMTVPFEGAVTAVAFAPDGERYAMGGTNATIRVFKTKDSESVGYTLKHDGPVTSVGFSPDGGRLVTGSADGTARVWDAATGQPVLPVPARHPGPVNGVAFGPAGRTVVTACDDRTAQVWDAATGLPLGRPAVHASRVLSVGFSPDGRWYVTASDDNTARVWDAATGEPAAPPLRYSATAVAVRFSPDGHHLLVAAKNRLAEVWDLIAPADLAPAPAAAPPPRAGPGSAASPDGSLILSYGAGQTARVRDAATHEARTPPLRVGSAVAAAAFSPDGTLVATGEDDGAVQVWRVADGAKVWGTPGQHASRVQAVAFSRDGKRLATGGEDNTARVWDAATGVSDVTPINLRATVDRVEFDPTGLLLGTVTEAGAAQVWDVYSGEPVTPPFRPRADWAAALAPTDWPLADLQAAGRLFAGTKLTDTSDEVPLDPAELLKLQQELMGKYRGRGEFGTPPAGARAWSLGRAKAAEDAGDWFAAAWHLDRLAVAAPGDPELRRRRAAAAAKLGDWDRAVRLDPGRADNWYHRGVARGKLGDWGRAAADFAKAAELRADPAAAVGLAARVALEAGDAAEYRRLVAELAGRLDDPRAVWACVLAADSGADPAKLVEAAKAAGPLAHGLALVRAGRPADAVGELKAAGDRPAAWAALALALAKQGKPAEAKVWRDRTAARLTDGGPLSWDERTDAGALLREFDGR